MEELLGQYIEVFSSDNISKLIVEVPVVFQYHKLKVN